MKQYKIITVDDIVDVENAINNFIESKPEYDLKNIVFNNPNYVIIFEKYKS